MSPSRICSPRSNPLNPKPGYNRLKCDRSIAGNIRKELNMSRFGKRWLLPLLGLALLAPASGQAACCYFSAKNADILQPAQKVFITWDPKEKVESFTVQPKFEGNALDFGMVIPTPSQPKLDTMPRDFFKHLAVYTIMRKREFPQSKLLPLLEPVKLEKLLRQMREEQT